MKDLTPEQRTMKIIKKEWPMVGLSAGDRVTCLNAKIDDLFWATSALPDGQFESLFNWFKKSHGKWEGNEKAILEYEKVSEDGTPIDPKLVDFII